VVVVVVVDGKLWTY